MSGCPVLNGPTLPGAGETDYERYMRVDELLSLQKSKEEAVHHDELMFQTIHQAFELWLKLVLNELREVGIRVRGGDWKGALPLLRRSQLILDNQTTALKVLNTMTPMDFHVIRAHLGNGSGAESPGFRRILQAGPLLWPDIEALIGEKGGLRPLYSDPAKDPEFLFFLETLMDVDEAFHDWRQAHLTLVKRMIGGGVKSLKGYAVEQLEEDVDGVLWPALWQVRNEVTAAAGTSPQ